MWGNQRFGGVVWGTFDSMQCIGILQYDKRGERGGTNTAADRNHSLTFATRSGPGRSRG